MKIAARELMCAHSHHVRTRCALSLAPRTHPISLGVRVSERALDCTTRHSAKLRPNRRRVRIQSTETAIRSLLRGSHAALAQDVSARRTRRSNAPSERTHRWQCARNRHTKSGGEAVRRAEQRDRSDDLSLRDSRGVRSRRATEGHRPAREPRRVLRGIASAPRVRELAVQKSLGLAGAF